MKLTYKMPLIMWEIDTLLGIVGIILAIIFMCTRSDLSYLTIFIILLVITIICFCMTHYLYNEYKKESK